MAKSKRCKAISPESGLRCEKHKKHVKTEGFPLHQHGSIVWAVKDGRVGTEVMMMFDSSRLRASDLFTRDGADRLRAAMNEGPPEFADERFAPMAPFAPSPEQQLIDWWLDKASKEAEATVPKAIEYGSTDLIDIGVMLARTMKRTVTEEEAAELGVFFYLIGKLARWQSAIERGERPSDDTLLDIGVYVRMAQRIRHAGGWPGTETAPEHRPGCGMMECKGECK